MSVIFALHVSTHSLHFLIFASHSFIRKAKTTVFVVRVEIFIFLNTQRQNNLKYWNPPTMNPANQFYENFFNVRTAWEIAWAESETDFFEILI